jgi:hypothetical protein
MSLFPKLFLLLGCVIPQCVLADQVVTFVKGKTPIQQGAKSYLAPTHLDEGYVTVVAKVSNPAGQTCIAPALNSFFSNRQLNVTITAQVFGFFGVDSSKEVPIATYSWTGSRYCRSAFQPPMVLVAPSPIGVREARSFSVSTAGPQFVFKLRSASSDSEKVTALAQGLLSIAGGLATGGAANTVVGLSQIAAGPAAKILSEQLNSAFKNTADQTWEVAISWDEIARGVQLPQIQLVSRELQLRLGGREQPKPVIDQLQSGKVSGTPILVMDFEVSVRRTIFADDYALDAKSLPSGTAISKYAVLNHPKKLVNDSSDFPTVFQRINSGAPSLLQNIAANENGACDRLLVTIRDLGFNALDRAIIIGTLLDDAYPGWNYDTKFRDLCLQAEPDIAGRLGAIRPGSWLDGSQLPHPEVTLNASSGWDKGYVSYMTDLRLAFFSNPEIRSKTLKTLFEKAPTFIDADLKVGANPVARDPRSDDFLKELAVNRIGCIFGFKGNAGELFSAMIFSSRDKQEMLHPYILLVRHGTTPPQSAVTAENLWIYSLDTEPGRGYLPTLQFADFGEASICYRGTGPARRTIIDVLADFKK